MIRGEQSIVHYDFGSMTATADRLQKRRDERYLKIAEQLIEIYRGGASRTRQYLHQKASAVTRQASDCVPRRTNAFCKLLDDASQFSKGKSAANLRQDLFSAAAEFHPVVEQREGIFEHQLDDVRRKLAERFEQSWESMEADLFSDVIELQTLQSFDEDLQPAELLSRYNLAQTQAMLYRTQRAELKIGADFHRIVVAVKLAGLMHQIHRINSRNPGYRIRLDGPQSSLRETTRYGIRFAQLLATLVQCRDWSLKAYLTGPGVNATGHQKFRCQLDAADGLKGAATEAKEFDSDLERAIFQSWQRSPVDGWVFAREKELLCIGQTVYTPDFSLRKTSDCKIIYVEVVGFWTPEYLAEKHDRLNQFIARTKQTSHAARWLLVFPARTSTDVHVKFATLGVASVTWKKSQDPKEWIQAALKK